MRRTKQFGGLYTGLKLVVLVGAVAAALVVMAPSAVAVPGAGYTSVDESVDGVGHCQNGNPNVNCNIYDGKQFVWLNGGPSSASFGDGSYFFAVLDPGGQADPNDGSAKNLSSPNDAYTNRTFSVSSGTVSYGGTHDFDSASGKIRLMPYNDTSNPGGVYILAICSLAQGYPVDPSTCKYDAFKIKSTPIEPASDLTITKDANGADTNTFTWGISKDADKTTVNTNNTNGVTFTYTVNVTHDSGTISGVTVSGTISVFNPNIDQFNNTVPVDINGITDKLSDGTVCSVTNGGAQTLTLAKTDFSYSCDLSALPQGELDNTASVSWPDQLLLNGAPLAANSASFTFKSISFAETTVDDCVTVTDTVGGTLGTACSSDPSPKSFTYQHTDPGVSGTCTDYDNTATFTTNTTGATDSASKTVTVCVGADLTVSKTASASFTRKYAWNIDKSTSTPTVHTAGGAPGSASYAVKVGHDAGTDSGWEVTGTITVTNPNDWEDIPANVSDSIDNGGTCTVAGGSGTILAGKSADFAYTCLYASAPSPAAFKNTATATWNAADASTPDGSATGDATGAFGAPTSVVDNCVAVNDTDPAGPQGQPVCVGDANPTEFDYSGTVTGAQGTCTPNVDTASFATNDTGTPGSDDATVSDCQGADLTASKTATPAFTRTYKWSINKSVDKTQVDPGGTVNYTVTVNQTGFTDSGWKVTGTITVHNPNDWESVALTGVTDAVDNGGTCTVSGNKTQTIAASGDSTGLTYSCTYASAPSPLAGTNTVTATWNKTLASTPDGSATGTKGFDFSSATPTTVNKTVTVTDTYKGTLGTCTATDSQPFATCTFKYSRTLSPPASGCVTVPNTATVVQTGQSSSASVQDCNSGALTMGFWQNKNGQALITGDKSTAGVCNLTTFLQNYKPFQDLSATATCAQVATYVTNVIKAANAGGTTMNPMLKAQMLATALDVYFSDPALGGNKISAPKPIGGLTIDLTKICKMIDGSSGATCTGGENASAAFGGATSMTVLQMLAYAASQSNSGGSIWYGNNKTTQGLAKDAFDSINNQDVVGP